MIPMPDRAGDTRVRAEFELTGAPITGSAFFGEGVGIALRRSDNELREVIDVCPMKRELKAADMSAPPFRACQCVQQTI